MFTWTLGNSSRGCRSEASRAERTATNCSREVSYFSGLFSGC